MNTETKYIYYAKNKNLYRVKTYRNKKQIDLGYYETFDDAKEVRDRNIQFPNELFTKLDFVHEKLHYIE